MSTPRDTAPARLSQAVPIRQARVPVGGVPPHRVLTVPAVQFAEPSRVVAPPAPSRGRRSLAGYLVMPRPGDAVKALLMPTTFGLAALAGGGVDGRGLLRALLVLLVLEFLVYPARYQWNDIRGFAADQRHPGEDRGRLPGPLSQARSRIAASGAVAILRLAVAAMIGLLPGLDLGAIVLAAVVGVFGVAAAYETLRAMATGRHSGATPPVRPALVALWITVGAGYAVRGLIGLALALDLRDRPALAAVAAVTLWAYGVAFVTSRWAVESMAFARLNGTRVEWAADASHAREHLLALTRWLPAKGAPRAAADGSLEHWAVLRGRTPVSAPWHLALSIAGAAAMVTGILLTAPVGVATPWVLAAAGGAGALVVACLPQQRLLAAAVVAAALLVALAATSVPRPLLTLLPWLAIMAAYLHFSAQSCATLGDLGRSVRRVLKRLAMPVVRVVIGHHTWQVLTPAGPAGE
jgi:hypothetical protein